MEENINNEENEIEDINSHNILVGPRNIYIVHLINTNYYKIGIADSIERRLRNLQTANPFELKLIYSKSFIECFSIETYIHNFYLKKNVKGEWFELLNEDIYEIMYFLKRLESVKNISGEINKRLRLQKKHKKIMQAIQKKEGISKINRSSKSVEARPKITVNKKTGIYTVYFRKCLLIRAESIGRRI